MDSIQQMYTIAMKAQSYGVQGYYIQNKYLDPRKIKEEKLLQTSKDKLASSRVKQSSKKKTYIDDLQKKEAHIPGPFTYDPQSYNQKQKQFPKIQSPPRKTIFDQISQVQKKSNFPAAGTYDKIEINPNKSKLRSNIGKAEICNYLENSMRKSIEYPGVGEYEAKITLFDRKGGKWVPENRKKSKSEKTVKWPQAATYNPKPSDYHLFGSADEKDSKLKSNSYFTRELRFKSSKEKTIPFYNIGSEWGMKDNLNKKDILSRVGSSLSHHSVYY